MARGGRGALNAQKNVMIGRVVWILSMIGLFSARACALRQLCLAIIGHGQRQREESEGKGLTADGHGRRVHSAIAVPGRHVRGSVLKVTSFHHCCCCRLLLSFSLFSLLLLFSVPFGDDADGDDYLSLLW